MVIPLNKKHYRHYDEKLLSEHIEKFGDVELIKERRVYKMTLKLVMRLLNNRVWSINSKTLFLEMACQCYKRKWIPYSKNYFLKLQISIEKSIKCLTQLQFLFELDYIQNSIDFLVSHYQDDELENLKSSGD